MKPQLKTLTWSHFEKFHVLQEKYGDFSGTILDILNHPEVSNRDKIWAFTRDGIMDDKTLQLFAVRCARQVQYLIKDERSVNALDVAERYAHGNATAEELEAAGAAAWAAAEAAEAAAGAAAWAAAEAAEGEAWDAAWAAEEAAEEAAEGEAWDAEVAWAAAIANQVQIAIELINEFYEVTN